MPCVDNAGRSCSPVTAVPASGCKAVGDVCLEVPDSGDRVDWPCDIAGGLGGDCGDCDSWWCADCGDLRDGDRNGGD